LQQLATQRLHFHFLFGSIIRVIWCVYSFWLCKSLKYE